MSIKPLNDRIVVKPLEAQEKSKGGIILTDGVKEKPQQGEVIATQLNKETPCVVNVGQIIVYGRYSGVEIETKEGEIVLIMKEEDVLAIVE